MLRYAIIACTALLTGCDVLSPRSCTTEFVYGIVVTAVDWTSGAPISDGLAGVTVKAGVTSDMVVAGNLLYGAGEDEGVHSLVVTAPGYELWTRDGVRVEGDECHVTTNELTAPLRPVPAP